MPAITESSNHLGQLQRSELLLAGALLGLLVVFLVPLPAPLLDMLLALNVSATILLLLMTLAVKKPLDFAVFPSVLLLLTLYRLALNVATTRLILLHGNAGSIVEAFGKFVVGGNLVVGLVIFLILVIIQFVVITKGAGRISEVSARFTLDAMPGKQMAIDAEMNAGHIDETEARRRRQELVRETEFYGTMDGASKFVRGDAIAAIIITAVNLIGGIIIGMTRNQNLTTAVTTYSILTIGDGLITQIPALIVATASGMLVTKATSQSSLGQEITSQVNASNGAMRLGALILLGMSALPGVPMLPFVVLGAGLFAMSRRSSTESKPAESTTPGATPAAPGTPGRPSSEMWFDDFLQTDRIGLELGSKLLSLVDSRRGSNLLDRISGLRRDLARQSGLWVPVVRVRDNISIEADCYRVMVCGREVARGHLRPDRYLAIDAGASRMVLEGERTTEPTFGLPAFWILDTERSRAELGGFTVVDPHSVVITHLGEIVRRHAHELLSREDVKKLVDKVRETSPALVDELLPATMTMGTLHRVLTLLLEERIAITHLTRILESLANHAPAIKDVLELTEKVRQDIGRAICDRFRDSRGRMLAMVLDPRLEIELRRGVQENRQLVVDPGRLERLILRLAAEHRQMLARGEDAALICDASLRRPLRQVLARSLGELSVIAYQEVPTDLLMESVAIIRPEELSEPGMKAAA